MTDASQAGTTPPSSAQELSRSLKPRHVSMITFGGIIGAGLFVGSSTAISTIGPAAVLSYALAGLIIIHGSLQALQALQQVTGLCRGATEDLKGGAEVLPHTRQKPHQLMQLQGWQGDGAG